MFTQSQYNLLQQNIRRVYVRIGLLNQNDVAFDYLEGLATGGSIDVSASSSHRRSGNLIMTITKNSNLLPNKDGKIWFNRKIEVKVGLKGAYSEEVAWFDLGRFAISHATLDRAIGVRQISITMLDYAAFLDGTLGGQIGNEVSIIASGVTVKEALESVFSDLARLNVDSFEVTNIKDGTSQEALIPYDITQAPGSTVHDLAKQIVELYKGYEKFFDPYGILRVQRVKDLAGDPIMWDFTQDRMGLVMNYTSNINFGNVHNDIRVWGNFNDDTAEQIYWRYRNKHAVETYSDLASLPTGDRLEGDIAHVADEDQAYAWVNDAWAALNFRVISEFCIDKIGTKTLTINDEKIFSAEQAQLRAEYELWNYSNFAETISFSCVPVYYLDVNQLVRIQEDSIGVDGIYRIESISIPLNFDGLMSITATKMYYN